MSSHRVRVVASPIYSATTISPTVWKGHLGSPAGSVGKASDVIKGARTNRKLKTQGKNRFFVIKGDKAFPARRIGGL